MGGRVWREKEYQKIKEYLDRGVSIECIAIKLNRTVRAIKVIVSGVLHYQPKCLSCGKKFIRVGARKRCNKCSILHTKKLHKKWLEKNRYSIKKKSHEKYIDYYTKNAGRLRLKINEQVCGGNWLKTMERDKYTCQICGKGCKEILLCVHHKDGQNHKSASPNHDMGNLVVWCKPCHARYRMRKKRS